MAVQPLGSTAYFNITYEDSLSQAKRRAQYLLANVDEDFYTLLNYFGQERKLYGDAVTTVITVQVQKDGKAHNNGYKADGSMLITLDSLEAAGATAAGDDGAMALFVAEMCEIMMSYAYQKTGGKWRANDSNGEGLSRFLAGTMHPTGYYYSANGLGPSVNTWFSASDRDQSNRDFVSHVNNTDTEEYSYGCALAFIYYLNAQLNYPIGDIILNGGALLSDTYRNLTGKTDAWSTFTALLDSYYPPANLISLPSDNPFPLLPALERNVVLSFSEKLDGSPRVSTVGEVVISPYIGCPAKTYSYEIDNTPQLAHCLATVTGFGEPQYSWIVNGQAIDVPVGSGRVITTITSVMLDNPSDPGNPTPSLQQVQILCRPTASVWTADVRAGGLDMYPYSTPGHVRVHVSVDVTEQYASNTGVTAGSNVTLIDQQRLLYGFQYYRDRAVCMQAFWDKVKSIAERYVRTQHLFIWQTLPDPGPELTTALKIVDELRGALVEMEQDHPREARQLRTMTATMLGVSPALLGGVQHRLDGQRATAPPPTMEQGTVSVD